MYTVLQELNKHFENPTFENFFMFQGLFYKTKKLKNLT